MNRVRKNILPPAITRRETIESLTVTGAGAGMLAGSPPTGGLIESDDNDSDDDAGSDDDDD
jgi:hypothetical protein